MLSPTLLATFLVSTVICTSDVRNSKVPALETTAAPGQEHVRKDLRHMDFEDQLYPPDPIFTVRTEMTTSFPTTEPQYSRNKYSIDYQEASRRGRSDVTIQLLPRVEVGYFIPEPLIVSIEYSKKVRRIRKVWGGKAKVTGNTVQFTTDVFNAAHFPSRVLSFGYTIDYRGRSAQHANYPVFMDIRRVEDEY